MKLPIGALVRTLEPMVVWGVGNSAHLLPLSKQGAPYAFEPGFNALMAKGTCLGTFPAGAILTVNEGGDFDGDDAVPVAWRRPGASDVWGSIPAWAVSLFKAPPAVDLEKLRSRIGIFFRDEDATPESRLDAGLQVCKHAGMSDEAAQQFMAEYVASYVP